nr:MAG TPA: hypothetical protein [Caudoviricetes sp.]
MSPAALKIWFYLILYDIKALKIGLFLFLIWLNLVKN